MPRKYALHPGYVTSKNDLQRHWIGVTQLARLYRLESWQYVIWDDDDGQFRQRYRGMKREDFIHLGPSYEGNYPDLSVKQKAIR